MYWPLPGHPDAVHRPNKWLAIEAATRGELELGFGRKFLAGPTGIGFCILISDVYDGMIFQTVDRALWSAWVPPVRPLDVRPPDIGIAAVDHTGRRREDSRGRRQHIGRGIRIVLWPRRSLGERYIARHLNETGEVFVRDGGGIDPEPIDPHAMGRSLLGIVMIGPHEKNSPWIQIMPRFPLSSDLFGSIDIAAARLIHGAP